MKKIGISILLMLLMCGCGNTNVDRIIEESNVDIKLLIEVNGEILEASLESNSSVDSLVEFLTDNPVTIDMRDYGNFEKVGSLGVDLPTNDEQFSTQAGDLILYQGNQFVLYYAPNTYRFTRLGRIDDITADKLQTLLGSENVTITLSIKSNE